MDTTGLETQILAVASEHKWTELCNVLEQNFTSDPNIHPIQMTPELTEALARCVKIIRKIFKDKVNPDLFPVLKSIYKALRNSVVYNCDVPKLIVKSSILSDSQRILRCLLKNLEKGSDCITMLLQFLVNTVVNNKIPSFQVWAIFNGSLKKMLERNVCLYHTMALIYNIFCIHRYLLRTDSYMVKHILDCCDKCDNNEYFIFMIELFIDDVKLNKTYIQYDSKHRIICLEMMKDMLVTNKKWVTKDVIEVLSMQFKQKSDCILKTVTNYLKEIEPIEVTLLLELLASISSDETLVKHLQEDKSLLINLAFLLKGVHSAGKESENSFTPISKLSLEDESDSEIFQHPSYGFKASIIRLLSNLCWKHKQNQDELRELDCIPLLLDCCNIDTRNPFIMQWVIYAVRNLCENNVENQRIIAQMNKNGVVNSAALLEMGLTLQNDEELTINIAPLDLNK